MQQHCLTQGRFAETSSRVENDIFTTALSLWMQLHVWLEVRAKNRGLVHVLQPRQTYRYTGQALHKAS